MQIFATATVTSEALGEIEIPFPAVNEFQDSAPPEEEERYVPLPAGVVAGSVYVPLTAEEGALNDTVPEVPENLSKR